MIEQFIEKFQIRSRYLGQWKARMINLDLANNTMSISQQNQKFVKFFPISELKIKQKNKQILCVCTNYGRIYEIKGQKIRELLQNLNLYEIYKRIGHHIETYQISIPKNIKYQNFCKIQHSTKQEESSLCNQTELKIVKNVCHPRQKSYIIQKDWAVNQQQGGLILIGQQKKKNQGKIIKFVVKKFITTGAFMGISFPVFAMKPQSILQTYSKSMGAAPLLFNQCPDDPTERIKRFIAFSFSFSRLFSDMDKPFNPTLGQTFQAKIGDSFYYAQQISHHPPQSAIFYQGKDFKIYATLQLVAQIGLNSATGYFNGDVTVQFQNKQKVIGRFLSGQMCGFLSGQNRFRPDGSNYVYDQKSKIVSTYKRTTKDYFRGYIGKLKDLSQNKFNKSIHSKERFYNFESFQKHDYSQIYSQMDSCWTQSVKFDRKTYIDFNDQFWLPYQPTEEGISILKSDSRFRTDIQYLKLKQIQRSQQQKEKIQQQQRRIRKIRNTFNKKNQNKHY